MHLKFWQIRVSVNSLNQTCPPYLLTPSFSQLIFTYSLSTTPKLSELQTYQWRPPRISSSPSPLLSSWTNPKHSYSFQSLFLSQDHHVFSIPNQISLPPVLSIELIKTPQKTFPLKRVPFFFNTVLHFHFFVTVIFT